MLPINFEGVNIDLAKPTDMTDEQCFSLPAEKNVDSQGFPYFLTAWMPNKEDLEALNAGRPLFLKVIGHGHPPVALFTIDEHVKVIFKINFNHEKQKKKMYCKNKEINFSLWFLAKY